MSYKRKPLISSGTEDVNGFLITFHTHCRVKKKYFTLKCAFKVGKYDFITTSDGETKKK